MAHLEVILRFLGFVLIAVLFARIYWRVAVRILGWCRVKAPKFLLAAVSGVLGIATLFLMLWFYVYHGFGYQPDIYRVGDRSSNKVAITLMTAQAQSLPRLSWTFSENTTCRLPFSWWEAM